MSCLKMSLAVAYELPIEDLVQSANDGCIFTVINKKLDDKESMVAAALIDMGFGQQLYANTRAPWEIS